MVEIAYLIKTLSILLPCLTHVKLSSHHHCACYWNQTHRISITYSAESALSFKRLHVWIVSGWLPGNTNEDDKLRHIVRLLKTEPVILQETRWTETTPFRLIMLSQDSNSQFPRNTWTTRRYLRWSRYPHPFWVETRSARGDSVWPEPHLLLHASVHVPPPEYEGSRA